MRLKLFPSRWRLSRGPSILLLQAASFGKCFIDKFPPESFVRMCQDLRVLNSIRDYQIGIPLTFTQYPPRGRREGGLWGLAAGGEFPAISAGKLGCNRMRMGRGGLQSLRSAGPAVLGYQLEPWAPEQGQPPALTAPCCAQPPAHDGEPMSWS